MKILNWFIRFLLFLCTYIVRRNQKWVAFGSWCGQQYSDNPRYIFEYLMKTENNFKLIWIGEEALANEVPQSNKTIFVKIKSMKSIYYLLRCKYLFVSQMAETDLSTLVLYRNAVITHCWHGVPVKKIGTDMISNNDTTSQPPNTLVKKIRIRIRRILGLPIQYDYYVSSSIHNDQVFESAFANLGASNRNILHSGYPRNDMFFNTKDVINRSIKAKYSQLLGFSMDKKIILYLPTYRRSGSLIESFCDRNNDDISIIDALLTKHNAVLVEKNHFVTYTQNDRRSQDCQSSLFKLSKEINVNVQELLLFTDVLISDYSGAFLDFSLLDRPIIHFAYDYDYYKNIDSGLYYDIQHFSAGHVATDFKGVIDELDRILSGNDEYKEKRKQVREEFMSYEKGHASEYICNTVLNQDGGQIQCKR